jgi:hypothetical protein
MYVQFWIIQADWHFPIMVCPQLTIVLFKCSINLCLLLSALLHTSHENEDIFVIVFLPDDLFFIHFGTIGLLSGRNGTRSLYIPSN